MSSRSIDGSTGYVLAFDFGLKYIGAAVGQTVTGTASPLATLTASQGRPDWQQLQALVDQWRPIHVIVGLPLNMDDTESDMSTLARGFADKLARRTGVAVALVDERLTSYAARDNPGNDTHGFAAVLIAETWLAERTTAGGPAQPR